MNKKLIPLILAAAMAVPAMADPEDHVRKNPSGGYQCAGKAWEDVETIVAESAKGEPVAMYVHAVLLDEGDGGLKEDEAQADKLFAQAAEGLQKLADTGDAAAMILLAELYDEGAGVREDDRKADKLRADARRIQPAKK